MHFERVEIFIPVAAGHHKVFPAALCSALTQTYPNKRIVIFLDEIHPYLEKIIKEWFYTKDDVTTVTVPEQPIRRTPNFIPQYDALIYEECKRGVIVRNKAGYSGSAHAARQWLFEWENKSDIVKMLDADDILTPRAIEIMMRHIGPEIDGVFCPMVRSSSCRYAGLNIPDPQNKPTGSGSMMLRRHVMDTMIEEGFKWPSKRGHDQGFFEFIRDRQEKFNFVTTGEFNLLYIYQK